MTFTVASAFVGLLAAASSVSSAAIQRRAVISHDAITPWPENVPGDAIGNTLKRFEPFLHIAHGCQSYPAVDGEGNTGGGLKNTGSPSGGCRDLSKGQTYVRADYHNGKYGIMYAWYFPKDSPSSSLGHRHDWEHVVVWVDDPTAAEPQLLGTAASGHGGYKKTATPNLDGTRPKVEYFTSFPTNHELQFTDTLGRDLPMMWYDFFPQVSKDALETTDFGSAIVPFKNSNFLGNLAKAEV
ncbi:putative necrosis and ethylene inducing peptide 1 precursor protein [Neofusicoccum parvum UCRNP2]|uniref:Uncharacterized protein EAF01_009705 n=2 Tax=Neofusicoccum parvum TaxID=310453 RepID=A0ACB5S032_9PEZI|nr:putative necrosis and ethylene inducing peptide 1 precursor protein [Neofusicoccum parvum UCRNP2]GME26132.1 uncharacterized protein EAF01_009705 [Neofusicoccum parvum]